MGKQLGGNSSGMPNFAPRDGLPTYKLLYAKKPIFRVFSPAARGSGGE
jgi:hypothetical protein